LLFAKLPKEVYPYDSRDLVPCFVSAGSFIDGPMLSFHESLRKNLIPFLTMIYLTAVVALLLFIYLFVALIRPEWF
jgi:K+-transporting ATPase KdpF subunit